MLRIPVLDRPERNPIKIVDHGVPGRQEDRRVGGDQELGMTALARLPHHLQEPELTAGGERRFRFIQ